MKTAITRAVAAMAAALLLLLGLAGISQAGHDQSLVTNLSGCLTPGGDFKNMAAGDAPAKPCGQNDTPIHLSSGDITKVQAGTGLSGGAIAGDATLTLDSDYTLPQSCPAGKIPEVDATGAWQCGTDDNTTYSAGTGLDLSGTTFSVGSGYQLPQSCAPGQVAKAQTGGTWVCAADTDTDTTYTGADFATSNQACPAGQYASAITGTGALTCSAVPAGNDVHAWTADVGRDFTTNIELAPIAENQVCCNFPVTTLLQVSVPAGTYVVTSSVELVNNNSFVLQDNSRDLGCGINTTFFNSYGLRDMPGHGHKVNVSPQRVVTVGAGGGTIALQCAMTNGATDRSRVVAGTRSLSALRLTANN